MKTILGTLGQAGNTPLVLMFLTDVGERHESYRIHRHAEFEISLVMRGRGIYRTRSRDYPIREGDLFLFRANEQHCISDIEQGGMALLTIQFSPRLLWDTDGEYLDLLGSRAPDFPNRLPKDAQLAEAILAIREEFAGAAGDYALLIRFRLLSALILLARREEFRRFTGGSKIPCSRRSVELAMDYIDSHFTLPLTLEEIAAQAGVSRVYFSTLFREVYGMPLWSYVEIRRIDRAKDLLRSTDDTVLSIATACGFNSTAGFNRIFRKMTGITPREYRAPKKEEGFATPIPRREGTQGVPEAPCAPAPTAGAPLPGKARKAPSRT